MKTLVAAAVAILAVTVGTGAGAPSVSGTWTMQVEGGPHGAATMGLVLRQDGKKVTGTFASGHTQDMAIEGEFADGALKVETTGGDADSKITFTAKLKDDGTLAGFLSSPMGDMKWTAARNAAPKKDNT
jgi:hypothetical protein